MEFTNKFKKALKKRLPFVAYKWPNESGYTLLIQKNDNLNLTKDFSQAGFVFTPFKKTEKTILIPFNQADLSVFSLPDYTAKINVNKSKEFRRKSSLSQNGYSLVITKAIQQIKNKVFNKVVLSRRIEINTGSLDFENLFYNLMDQYPTAFTYLWYHPRVGFWAGATPEKLLELNGESFSTMALAGTQIYKKDTKIVWGHKEQEEQQWVTKFISNALQKNKIPFNLSKPISLKAGHLVHICTEIKGVLPDDISLSKLIKSLHPTPAVAGIPRQKAIDFIFKNEQYNREYYTGFLGIINEDNKSKLFVNLRCMQIKSKKVLIYVGGGITADSNPLSEWQETKAKSETLLRLLFY